MDTIVQMTFSDQFTLIDCPSALIMKIILPPYMVFTLKWAPGCSYDQERHFSTLEMRVLD